MTARSSKVSVGRQSKYQAYKVDNELYDFFHSGEREMLLTERKELLAAILSEDSENESVCIGIKINASVI